MLKGAYIKNLCCTKCNWYKNPEKHSPYFKFEICPECASEVKRLPGRFIFEIKGIFFKNKKIVGFERK